MAPPTDLAQLTLDDEGETPGVILTSMAIQSWSEVYPDTPASAVVKPWYLPAGREHREPVHRDELAVAHRAAERVDPA